MTKKRLPAVHTTMRMSGKPMTGELAASQTDYRRATSFRKPDTLASPASSTARLFV
ncbi:hypothetical protein BX592_101103 [Paraburkholderia rhizosphaerae]|uniref:Uncharacterized protein n=1 Tax=Paraburkholderia rhizosphaerae TaxID=480658 RepID=A0A4V3HFR0_9BURK|nr:hypothetical protein BX592_101103 [Paraburkholderia rhizosphaerae]